MIDNTIQWNFQSELFLENFVWNNLEKLFDLEGLSRQYRVNNQICDILAVDNKKQLTILELKNTEDRYIIQQLTRYYDVIREYQPFKEKVDYKLPVRLIAIAPNFHNDSLTDLRYSKLNFELLSFQISSNDINNCCFELSSLKNKTIIKLSIEKEFHQCLHQQGATIDVSVIQLPPPKSLQKLTETLSPEQEKYVLDIRDCLLDYDERLREKGFTTRTVYGLGKGDRDIYKTKLCAEFLPDTFGFGQLQLRLKLPYPKRTLMKGRRFYEKQSVKGLTWVEVRHDKCWDKTTEIQLLFYFGKSKTQKYSYSLTQYATVYQELTGEKIALRSLYDLLAVALKEWRILLDN